MREDGWGGAGREGERCGDKSSWWDDCELDSREVLRGEPQGYAVHPVWASRFDNSNRV